MFRFSRIPVIIISFIIIIIAFIEFALNLSTKSLKPSSSEYSTEFVNETIKIFKNNNGIPFITTLNEDDAFFAIGYCHATDRLWQMDLMRRAARGRLSEVFGKETLYYDNFLRAVGIGKFSDELFNKISKKSKAILESYSKGVNFYITENRKRLPFEFGALGYVPDPWRPSDCLAIARLMAFEMSFSFYFDVAFGEIAYQLDYDKAQQLIPDEPDYSPCIIPTKIESQDPKGKKGNQSPLQPLSIKTISAIYGNYLSVYDSVSALLGFRSSIPGSNSWVMKNLSKNPPSAIMANDPHLALSLPARWYQIHVSTPHFDVIGLTIPGNPLFVTGRNRNITWGITNLMLDDCDFFIEMINPKDSTSYMNYSGKYEKFKFSVDTVKIKNSPDFMRYLRSTKRSNVISDVHLFNFPEKITGLENASGKSKLLKGFCLTFSWTGLTKSDEVLALYRINKASNWNEFLSGARLWGSPALNFSYGDIKGNIGLAPTGLVPLRDRCTPNIPNQGWMEEFSWKGVLTSNSLPYLYNPDNNRIISANNKLVLNFEHFLSNYWEPSSRAQRIAEILEQFGNYKEYDYTVKDAQAMQVDYYSPYAKQLLSMCMPVLDKYSLGYGSQEKTAYQLLRNWDYILSASSVAASIYNALFERLIYNTFSDELGERIYRNYVFVSSIPTRKILELMKSDSSEWFDDVRTKEIENKETIVSKSFRQAVTKLDSIYGNPDVNTWSYGKIHKLTLKHIFGSEKFLEPSLTVGPYEIGGNNTTINNTDWKIYKPFDVFVGASMRFITDMSDTLVFMSLPGGASGDPLSPNFSDQLFLWLNGGYLRLSTKSKPEAGFELFCTFEPKGK
ncbi:MAG: Penicillin amidase [Ignavibacteria bacterium]|nr:Penicillin amidase [Ignavibacteria bacterium]